MSRLDSFNEYRAKMNKKILDADNKVLKRFFSLDNQTYQDSALPKKTKEMIGLAASLVLRCDDCVKYHLLECYKESVSTDEVFDIFAIANIIGGSICIPHTRRAVEFWEEICGQSS